MKLRSLIIVVVLSVASLATRTDAATDPLSYDDAGMHFKAPDGWTRVPTPENASDSGDGKKLLAAYTLTPGKMDSRLISIVSEPFAGTLEDAEGSQETELRSGTEGTLIDHKAKTTLANGMPAWFIRISQGSDPFTSVRTFAYVVFDGTRTIVASYSGRQLLFDDDVAKKALSSLYVVVYPKNRP